MTFFTRHPRLRWAVPAAAGALIVGTAIVGAGQVAATSGLPARTAQELLVALQSPQATSVSGTVSATADLGLPELPTAAGSSDNGPMALLSGTHTLRVWSDGSGKARVDLLDKSGEYDVVTDGSDAWLWNSADSTAVHYPVPPRDANAPKPTDAAVPSTPQEAADMVLANIGPTTDVSVSGAATVAGRPVYDLVLTPKQDGTKVSRVVLSVDAENNVPLRVQAFSKQTNAPAFDIGFTSVDFSTPDASVFAFTPPPGATVTERQPDASAHSDAGVGQKPVAVGDAWTRVMIARMPQPDPNANAASGDAASADQAAQLLQSLPTTSGSWGSGRILDGTLFSAILTDDGRVAVGAVTPEVLGAALASQ